MKKISAKFFCLCFVFIFLTNSLMGCSTKEKYSNDNTAGDTTSYQESGNSSSNYNDVEYYTDNMAANETSDGATTEDMNSDYGIYDEKESVDLTEFNTEEYNTIVENDYRAVKNNPLSTFSIDVDTASYSNIRRMINQYGAVQPEAVRIEEMINYFHYDYNKPSSDKPFAVTTEYSNCPWNEEAKLLLIGLQAKEIDMDERPSTNLVFLLDVSGSMNEADKLPLMQNAFRLLADNLNENDRISIVTYAGDETIVLEGARGDETVKIVSAIEELTASGSTAGSKGIETAYELAKKYYIPNGINRVILATDGDLNVGVTSEGALTKLIEEKREDGVFLSVLGFGYGNYKDNKLEALADHGNGNYCYIDSILEAKKVLVEEMGGTLISVAKDVKIQVEFNPAKIKGYRLIGYENRMLNTEDFEDDTKDAGEIGAGHRVTAIYEIIDMNSNQEIPETKLRYQDNGNISNGNELLTVKIRYKEPDEDTSKLITVPINEGIFTQQMTNNLTFASAVAAFGMLLRDSEYKGSASYDMVLNMLDRYDFSADEYKEEFVALVQKMRRMD